MQLFLCNGIEKIEVKSTASVWKTGSCIYNTSGVIFPFKNLSCAYNLRDSIQESVNDTVLASVVNKNKGIRQKILKIEMWSSMEIANRLFHFPYKQGCSAVSGFARGKQTNFQSAHENNSTPAFLRGEGRFLSKNGLTRWHIYKYVHTHIAWGCWR